MTVPPLDADAAGVRRWTCDGCGNVGPWTDTHRWYGSWLDEEATRWSAIVITCSQVCRDHLGADPLAAVQSGLPHRTRPASGRPVLLTTRARTEDVIDVPVRPRTVPGGQAA